MSQLTVIYRTEPTTKKCKNKRKKIKVENRYCYWLGRYTPANRSAGICCASCSAVRPVYGRRSCAKSVENSSHHSDTQSAKANSSGGLQADFNNAGPFAVSRIEHSNSRFESIRFVMRIDSFCKKKSAFRFTSCHAVFALNK